MNGGGVRVGVQRGEMADYSAKQRGLFEPGGGDEEMGGGEGGSVERPKGRDCVIPVK